MYVPGEPGYLATWQRLRWRGREGCVRRHPDRQEFHVPAPKYVCTYSVVQYVLRTMAPWFKKKLPKPRGGQGRAGREQGVDRAWQGLEGESRGKRRTDSGSRQRCVWQSGSSASPRSQEGQAQRKKMTAAPVPALVDGNWVISRALCRPAEKGTSHRICTSMSGGRHSAWDDGDGLTARQPPCQNLAMEKALLCRMICLYTTA